MLYKVRLKNADDYVLLSGDAFEFIEQNEYYKSINLLENLRLHSRGYAFFQRNFPSKSERTGYKNLTIYLHKLVCEKFVPKPETDNRLFVRFINGNPLDCRTKNLEWATMSELRRHQRNHNNKTGYRGVVKVSKNSYRAVLYTDSQRHDLGLFETPEEAAQAYNSMSEKLFGKTRSLNKL